MKVMSIWRIMHAQPQPPKSHRRVTFKLRNDFTLITFPDCEVVDRCLLCLHGVENRGL
jgi:hypothetical protein